jgi:hypothetical protein
MEILALCHQIMVLERQLGKTRPRFCPGDRAFLAALLHRLPREVLDEFSATSSLPTAGLIGSPSTRLTMSKGEPAIRFASPAIKNPRMYLL